LDRLNNYCICKMPFTYLIFRISNY
jgi:hypothetical protein